MKKQHKDGQDQTGEGGMVWEIIPVPGDTRLKITSISYSTFCVIRGGFLYLGMSVIEIQGIFCYLLRKEERRDLNTNLNKHRRLA